MALAFVPIGKVQEAVNLLTSPNYLDPRLKDFAKYFTVGLDLIQWTLVIVNIFGEIGRLFYNINYMLNSEHLSLVNKIGDKTEFTITRVHCILPRDWYYIYPKGAKISTVE